MESVGVLPQGTAFPYFRSAAAAAAAAAAAIAGGAAVTLGVADWSENAVENEKIPKFL